MVSLELLAHLGQPGTLEHLDHLAQQARAAVLVLSVSQVLTAHLEHQVILGHQVHKVIKDNQVLRDNLDQPDPMVPQAELELQDRQDYLETLELLERQVR